MALTAASKGRGLVALARVVILDLELCQQLLLARARLVLHLHVRVECHEGAVGELGQRVDLGQRQVAFLEQPCQAGEDGGQARQRAAGHAGGGNRLLGLEIRHGEEVGVVPPADVVGVGLGHLFDVDPAHVGEEHHRLLARPVPDHACVVLLLDLGLRIHQNALGHVSVDLQLQDRGGVSGGLVGRVGELDSPGLHPTAGEHLGLDHRWAPDVLCDLRGLLGAARETVLGDRYAGLLDYLACFVFKEPHDQPAVSSS